MVCLRSQREGFLWETGILGFEVSVTSVQVPATGRDVMVPILWHWNKSQAVLRCPKGINCCCRVVGEEADRTQASQREWPGGKQEEYVSLFSSTSWSCSIASYW